MKIGLYCISVLCKKKKIELYLFTYTGFQHNFHIRWCSCRLTVTLWVSHVEQELLTFLEHLTSPLVFSGVCVAWYLVFCVMFCRSLFVLLSFLAIVLSVLQFTASDCPFGIFKTFISDYDNRCSVLHCRLHCVD